MERSMAEEGNATKRYEELTLILGWLLITLYVVTPTQIFSHVLLQKFQILLKMNLGFSTYGVILLTNLRIA